jgi:hypothetical protein
VVLFAVAGIAALFCNIASSAGFALIVPDRRQLGDVHLVDEPLELRERAVEAVSSPPRPRSSCRAARPACTPRSNASGTIIGSLHARHRGSEFLSFLRKIDANVDLT